METIANLNGTILPLSEARVPVLDRGFLFGDAVYEGLHLGRGRIRFLEDHLARLRRSLAELAITGVDLDRLRERLEETVQASGCQEAFIYIQISRGVGPRRSHAFPDQCTPTELIFVEEFRDPFADARQHGGRAVTFADWRWRRCDIKTVNLLGNVLAAQFAREQGALEAILIRDDGTVTEGTRTSVFGVVAGQVRTYPQSPAILPGVTRGFVLRLVRDLGLPLEERPLQRDELPRLEECFFTGTTAEVLPIVSIDGRPVGEGQVGPMTRRLQAEFRRRVDD
ncbi:MAG TPA: D-amino acid aminotransferase [Gemmatales bacterium]|nr:D-amino acid aminotransferase [Gemmatales bacterium]HMP57861.1 D-amino acid aminotransferase [Gemmatales bacterium]